MWLLPQQQLGHRAPRRGYSSILTNSKRSIAFVKSSFLKQTPGARAAKVPQFIDLLLAERETQMQAEMTAGVKWLDRRSRELFGSDFVSASSEQQIDLLNRISSPDSPEDTLGQVFFQRLKTLTVVWVLHFQGRFGARTRLRRSDGYRQLRRFCSRGPGFERAERTLGIVPAEISVSSNCS